MEKIEFYIRNESTDDLIQMVKTDYEQYTEDALGIARDELLKRGVAEEEMTPGSTGSSRGTSDDAAPSDNEEPLDAFVASELEYPETYNAIYDFVTSANIRSGEYEGEKYVVAKMDRENFIVYAESLTKAGRVISHSTAIGKAELVRLLDRVGEEKGYAQGEESEEDDE